jgi:hypothetical protein
MAKRFNPYIKQAIELAQESKKEINISKELIESISDDAELGAKIREMLSKKITDCDEYIKHMESLKENYN